MLFGVAGRLPSSSCGIQYCRAHVPGWSPRMATMVDHGPRRSTMVLGGPGEVIWGPGGVVPRRYCVKPFSNWLQRAVLERWFRGYLGGIDGGVE